MMVPASLPTNTVDLAHIPDVLTALPQWVLWRGEDTVSATTGEIRLNKIPIDPQTLRNASSTDQSTWGTFPQCVQALPLALEEWQTENPSAYRGGGIGFVFTADDPYCGVDLDHSVDPNTNHIADWAHLIVAQLTSYTQRSVSGTGLHVILEGTLPPGRRQKGDIQMWDESRFFAMTGWHLPGTPCTIEKRHRELLALHHAIFVTQDPPQGANGISPAHGPALDDATLLAKARAAKNGAKFTRLWEGDSSEYASPSEADLALCSRLAFWTRDAAQIDQLFRQSALYREKKWNQRTDYRERTITAALAGQTAQYTQDGEGRTSAKGTADIETVFVSLGYNDTTNAIALVRDHGHNLRYCYPWKSWLVWTGTHWERDTSGAVMRLAKQTVKRMLERAAALADDDKLKALMVHIKKSLSTAALDAMIRNAQSEEGIAVQPDAFDTDVWLLNVQNGTVDLQTGTLRPHRQADMLTKCLAIPSIPEATCPLWEHFLWRIMGGTITPDDPELSSAQQEDRYNADERARALTGFLQRAIGYALTGSTREQCLFILHGITKTGKSTFLATLRAFFGSYGQQADMSSFMHKDRQEVRNDLADLAGSRFVCALESQEGQRLAESLIKQLTGGVDLIKARFLFQEHFTFRPQFKIFLGTNHKPVIKDTDGAIWERIRLVPFTVQIPKEERDKALDEKLQHELPGILAWAVRGCLEWQRLGDLREPEAVVSATTSYREESDAFGRFLGECCLTKPEESSLRCEATKLYETYLTWCKRNGEQEESQTKFGRYLTEHAIERTTVGRKVWRVGVGLVDATVATVDNGCATVATA